MKWALAAVVFAFVGFMVYLRLTSTKTMYVNGLPEYTMLPGREFILERECYIFKFKTPNTDWPLIGSSDTVPDLPADVKGSNVGMELPNIRILDVLHVGDHFHIASVRRDQGPHKTTVTFEILLQDEAARKYPRLDAFWIMDHSPEKDGAAPRIMKSYAVSTERN
jgi:hypothetical protein